MISRRRFITFSAATALSAVLACAGLTGCGSDQVASTAASTTGSAAPAALEGKALNIYCGAGMTDPFQEIANAFEQQTGCTMNITFANAAQIQTQIKTTGEGDFFIAGSKEELKPVQDSVTSSIDLVKHIPVLAVPEGNPANIQTLADLPTAQTILIGDPESTPIGKVAAKAMTDAGVMEAVKKSGAITTSTTAPQIAQALAQGEGDAGIVWKENATKANVTILENSGMEDYVKVIPCALLTSAANAEATDAFQDFLQTEEAQAIWTSYGYELA